MKLSHILRFIFFIFTGLYSGVAAQVTSATGGIITYSESHSSYPGTKAFDGLAADNYSGRWLGVASTLPNMYVTYQFKDNRSYAVDSYKIWNQTRYSVASRAVKDFSLLGSSNGTDWVTLDVRMNETDWTDAECRLYTFANNVKYSHYKLLITANNGDSEYCGLSELQLFSSSGGVPEVATTPVPADGSNNVRRRVFLEWITGVYATSNIIYLSSDSVITAEDKVGETSLSSFDPGYLDYDTTYFWRVDGVNSEGITTGTVWQFTVDAAPASFVAYDGFEDLEIAELNEQGDDSNGWTESWNAYAGVTVADTGLSYSKGDVYIDGGNQSLSILNVNQDQLISRMFNVQTNGPIYFSMLIQRETDSSDNLLCVGLKESGVGDAYNYTSGINFGWPENYITAEAYDIDDPSRIPSDVLIQDGNTYFLIAKITRTGDDLQFNKVSVLVNPSTLTEPEEGWTEAEKGTIIADVLNLFNVRSKFMQAGCSYLLDEIRIGTRYDAVVIRSSNRGTALIIN